MSAPIGSPPLGKVYLVGAGPGDPGLMTIKGKALLENSDVVVYDALVSPQVLQMINPKAEQIYAGKRSGRHSLPQEEITALLTAKAREHAVVVRLKGGDPFVFGRGGEELEDLIANGIPVEVVPGVTAGVAVPAYAGIPLTHRKYSSSVAFVAGHQATPGPGWAVNWKALAQGAQTLVVYMGVQQLPQIVASILEAGRPPETPIALIRWGTTPQQQTLFADLGTVVERVAQESFDPPAIIVVGDVVRFSQSLKLQP
jgi:uroporphyrin-III C-methyltransferase